MKEDYKNFYFALGFLVWIIFGLLCLTAKPSSYDRPIDQYENCDIRRC